MKFVVSYPENRVIDEATLRSWASDAVANGEIEGPEDADVLELARQLNDAGDVSLRPLDGEDPDGLEERLRHERWLDADFPPDDPEPVQY